MYELTFSCPSETLVLRDVSVSSHSVKDGTWIDFDCSVQFQLSVAEVELRAANEERDKLLNDANFSSLQNDEAVTRARQERDEAIDRKKAAEVFILSLDF